MCSDVNKGKHQAFALNALRTAKLGVPKMLNKALAGITSTDPFLRLREEDLLFLSKEKTVLSQLKT